MRSIFLAVLLVLNGAGANAQICHQDAVSTAPGPLLITQKGQTFEIFPGEGMQTATWLPADRLSVCRIGGNAFVLTDTDRRDGHVKALYLANGQNLPE